MMVSKRLFACAVGAGLVVSAAPAIAADGPGTGGDPAKGAKVVKKCMVCHSLKPGKKKLGPSLAGVFGRKAGTIAKFKYSVAMVKANAKGLVWEEETLFGYLENPKKYLRSYVGDPKAKNKMIFRLKKPDERKHVIAYLKSRSNK